METLISKLPSEKIKINWNSNPIRMDLFTSFLMLPLTKSTDHLGASTGWTQYENEDKKLIVGGGIINGVDYLDRLQYGIKLQNPYNNYCNPFYLKEILTKEGIEFFKHYYRQEIAAQLALVKGDIERFKNAITSTEQKLIDYQLELNNLSS